jgi:hypothetical protein
VGVCDDVGNICGLDEEAVAAAIRAVEPDGAKFTGLPLLQGRVLVAAEEEAKVIVGSTRVLYSQCSSSIQ